MSVFQSGRIVTLAEIVEKQEAFKIAGAASGTVFSLRQEYFSLRSSPRRLFVTPKMGNSPPKTETLGDFATPIPQGVCACACGELGPP